MENAILRNMTCFVKADYAKFLRIKIKGFINMLKSRMICYGLNFLKNFCCCAYQCIENLKKLI